MQECELRFHGILGGSSFFLIACCPIVILRVMGRRPRTVDDGLIYHAINRGNNRADVFGDDSGRVPFLEGSRQDQATLTPGCSPQ